MISSNNSNEFMPNKWKRSTNFVEEILTFHGKKLFCYLCNKRVDNNDEHCEDDRHKTLLTHNQAEQHDDKFVLYKMQTLSQTELELKAVSDLVLSCEQALKVISDEIHFPPSNESEGNNGAVEEIIENKTNNASVEENIEKDTNDENNGSVKENTENNKNEENIENNKNEEIGSESIKDSISEPKKPRLIRGVMRAGCLANGLLMKGETDVVIVLIVDTKPTKSLFYEVAEKFTAAIKDISGDVLYHIEPKEEEACLLVSTTQEAEVPASCSILFTSLSMRKHAFKRFNEINSENENTSELLNANCCESALQMLRRARWFDSKVYSLTHCEVVMKILRNLCSTDDIWKPLNEWTLQLIVHRCLSSIEEANMPAWRVLLRVFEMLATAYLLTGGPGLYDPCEREPTNLCDTLTLQQREDITYYSQRAMRLIAVGQINKLLDLSDDLFQPEQKAEPQTEPQAEPDTLMVVNEPESIENLE